MYLFGCRGAEKTVGYQINSESVVVQDNHKAGRLVSKTTQPPSSPRNVCILISYSSRMRKREGSNEETAALVDLQQYQSKVHIQPGFCG